MQKRLLCGFFLIIFLNALFAGSVFAGSITINDIVGDDTDSYWGGTLIGPNSQDQPLPSDFGDVVWDPQYSDYNVDSMIATQSPDGSTTTVTLTGYYFYSYLNALNDTDFFTPGDLYISSAGWQVSDSSGWHFDTDTFTQNEGWNYVIPFTSETSDASGTVYNLDFNGIQYTNTGLSTDYYYRADQAWRGGYGTPAGIGASTVSLFEGTAANGYNDASLTFSFPSLGDPASMGYHWTMMCGNDIVEGGNPVPEPSTMILFGTGLLGILVVGKRQFAGI
jgi:hypothetical protein